MSSKKNGSRTTPVGTDPVTRWLAGAVRSPSIFDAKAGAQLFISLALATFPDVEITEARRLQNQYWNAFKHATTRGGEEREVNYDLLRRFTDEHTLRLS
jgi:hypothetical protein